MTCSKIFLVFFVTSSTSIFASPVTVLGVDDDRTELCKEKLCIPKCCEEGKYLNSSASVQCTDSDKEYSLSHFSNMPVYGIFANGTLNKATDKKLGDIPFYLVPGRMYEKVDNENFERKYPFVAEAENMESYLTETGHVYLENTEIELLKIIQYFCVEYVLSPTHDEAKPQIVSIPYEGNDPIDPVREEKSNRTYYSAIISSVFLVIVLLVYIVLPELRNLGGMILMAYVTSLLFAFIILAVMQGVAPVQSYICIYRTASLYFFLLSAFCWMNVMSIDIWWTFRGYAKARPIHRRGEHFKFCMYGLYGWGLPGIMTAGLVGINEADLSQWPWIITPRIPNGGCFLMGIQKNLYLYTPMTILILSNWMFFLMTAYNIWRLTRGTAILNSAAAAAGNPAAHRKQMTRLKVYLKLSVIMGINWLFESVSSVAGHFALWEYTDMYNLIIGVAIFFIFVFKKKIYNKLKLRSYELLSRFIDGSSAQPGTKSGSSASTSQTPRSQSHQWRIPLRNL